MREIPAWAAHTLQTIPLSELMQLATKADDERLYDLVFETRSRSDIPLYTVRDEEGNDLTVGSEAANPKALPCTAAFVLALIKAAGPHASKAFHQLAGQRATGTLQKLHHHHPARASAIGHGSSLDQTIYPTISTALSILDVSPCDTQDMADAVEFFIGSFGLSLEVLA